jgi:EAL domain-containing protein (putative c-di-GMP-specific phosphodiesterase class I)
MVESEELYHSKLVEFREKIKTYGVKFFIDDFGLDYLN